MTSNRPYMVRALYEWILDNQMTPYLLVDAAQSAVVVPSRFVQDGKIVLNISPSAVHSLVLGNERIDFAARFNGTSMAVQVPLNAVLGVYARENGRGMLFPDQEVQAGDSGSDHKPDGPPPSRERPTLKVVK